MRAKTNNYAQITQQSGGIDLDDFLSRLDKVQKHGPNYMARCPAHNDGRPSLRVAQGDKGILVSCFAGCTYHEIVESMGLRPHELFTDALTDSKRAEYRFRGVLAAIKRLEATIYFYQHDMDKGLLSDSDKRKFQEYIQEKNQKCDERNTLVRDHGFKT